MIVCILSLSACGNAKQAEHTSESNKVDEGRPETKSIQAAAAVGYDGTAIRAKVDTVLDANDQRIDDLDKEIDVQTDGAENPQE